MATSKLMNQKSAIAFLRDHGWTRVNGGKHVQMKREDAPRPLPLPSNGRQDYSRRTTHGILRQAGLEKADWDRWNSRSKSAEKRITATQLKSLGLTSPSSKTRSPKLER